MTILPNTPTSAEVHADLAENGGRTTVLAQVKYGPITAQVTRYDAKDGEEGYTCEPQIVFNNAEQDGGSMFDDLCVLPDQVEDHLAAELEIHADYKVLNAGGIEIERDPGAFEEPWPVSAGTPGTPSLYVGPNHRCVCASTYWQENLDGDRTEILVNIDAAASAAFYPREALQFAVHLAQEASRAMAIENGAAVKAA